MPSISGGRHAPYSPINCQGSEKQKRDEEAYDKWSLLSLILEANGITRTTIKLNKKGLSQKRFPLVLKPDFYSSFAARCASRLDAAAAMAPTISSKNV